MGTLQWWIFEINEAHILIEDGLQSSCGGGFLRLLGLQAGDEAEFGC
ncbi:MAG TPA: hypothetical protein VGI40_14065 [Pirellulaceae bacterium]|jgi:hypothetical protein